MKKNIWVRLILAVMLIALIVSLAACGGKGDKGDDKKGDKGGDQETPDLFDQIIEIVKSVNPLVETLNGIKADSTVGLDVGLGVNYNLSDNANDEHDYSLALKGNVKAANSEVQLAIQDNKKTSDKEWILLAYKDGKAYLKQPLTAVNTGRDADVTSADLTAIKDDINILTDVLMYVLGDVSLDLNFEELGDSLKGITSSLGSLDLSELLSLTTDGDTKRLIINSASAKTIVSILQSMILTDTIKPIADAVVNMLFEEAGDKGFAYLTSASFVFPTIFVEAKVTNNALKGIKLGFDYAGVTEAKTADQHKHASLYIDLNTFSTSSTVTVSAPAYATKSLKLSLGAEMTQKETSAILDLYATGNMINTSSVLANGTLTVTKGEETGVAKAYYNGQKVLINLNDAFEAVGSAPVNGKLYSVKAELYNAMHEGLTKWRDEVKTPANGSNAADTSEDLSLMQSIYQFLGGNVAALNGADPTQTQMLTAIKNKVGDYVRFQIKTTSYADAIEEIIDEFNDNKDTLKEIIAENDAWEDIAAGNPWIGSLFLTKAGNDNDLLDAINLFFCSGKTDGVPDDITVEFLTEKANRYLAILALSGADNLDPDVVKYKAAIEKIDNKLLFAKNEYLSDPNAAGAKAKYDQAKDDHYEALKFENGIDGDSTLTAQYFANKVMAEIFGFEGTGSDYLADFINSGVTVKIVCIKDGGLNGGLGIWGNTDDEEIKYFGIEGYIGVVDKDITTGTDFDYDALTFKELTDSVETEDDDYKVILRWEDGTKKIDLDGSSEEVILYLYQMDGDDFVYDKKYENALNLAADLWRLLEAYKAA